MSQIDIMQDKPRANSSIWFTLCLDGDYKGYPVRKLQLALLVKFVADAGCMSSLS